MELVERVKKNCFRNFPPDVVSSTQTERATSGLGIQKFTAGRAVMR
jgi:hypothetical protein